MELQEFFTEWKDKFPKCFRKIQLELEEEYKIFYIPDKIYYTNEGENVTLQFCIRKGCYTYKINFKMLTGIIEKFFGDNNLKVGAVPKKLFFNIDSEYWFAYCGCVLKGQQTYFVKQEAQMTAYLKAAEILEKKLS